MNVPPDAKLRLLSFAGSGGAARLGVAGSDSRILDVADAAKAAGIELGFEGTSMMALIGAGAPALAKLRRLAHPAAATGPKLGEVRLLPPIPKIARNIFCVGWNYLEHFDEGARFRETDQTLPAHPVFFTKGTNTLNGPFDPIPYDPAISSKIDWEVELAVIIGAKGSDIAEADAMRYVFGFTVFNDLSARDVQRRHGGQWFKGKSLDGHGPMGPWIVPADELDVDNLHLICRVNGVVKQEASTKQIYFKVPRLIADLSRGLTLEPGDIIATGTPPGVGFARTPPEWLQAGDVMETEIVEIGTLRNVIGAS